MSTKFISLYKSKEEWKLVAINFTIPAYFILDANNQFWQLIPGIASLKIFLFASAALFILYVGISRVFKPSKSAILISVYSLWYLFFKTIQTKIVLFKPFSFLANLGFYLIASLFFLILTTAFVCYLKESSSSRISKYFNLLFAVFATIEIGKAGIHLVSKNEESKPTYNFSTAIPVQTPDIFLIVMDEYAGIQSAKSNFEFDNSEFVSQLRTAGFYVANNPSSNYNSTLFSLASMLNFDYSNRFVEKDLKDISAFGKAAKEIENNILVPFLISKGYSIKNYSGFRIKSVPSDAFYFMAIENRLALEKTFGSVLKNDILTRVNSNSFQQFIGTHLAQVDNYNKSVYNMSKLEFDKGKSEQPRFVYSHFFMPHEPFLYTADGQPRKYADAFFDKRKGTYKQFYAAYMQFTNNKIMLLIEKLLKQKGEKMVLLVSDHGERYTNSSEKGTAYNNFFAVYDSQKNYQGFTDTFPLINTFRVVLNTYFNQQMPMLENSKLNVYTGKSELF